MVVCMGVLYKKLRLKLVILLVTTLYIPLVSFLIFIFTPIYIFRFFIGQVSKFLRPDLDKLIPTRSVVLAVDGFPSNPSWNIVVWLTQEGILDLEKFQKVFLRDYVLKRDLKNGSLVYPEYQQHVHKWCGFYFWRWDHTFDIKNHIREYDGKYSQEEFIDDSMLVQIVKELTWKSWNPKRSPWEFLQIKNYQSGNTRKSILIFRVHHVIGDGYYVLKLLMGDLCEVNLDTIAKPNYLRRNIFQTILFGLSFWVRAPYDLCKMYIEAYDVNPWHVPYKKFSRPMNAALTEPISIRLIKDIKNAQGVSFSAVLNSGVAGGIRKMMIERGIKYPEDIHMGIPVPMPGRPQKLRNHFICSFVTLPVGTDDPIRRLKRAENIFQAWRRSSAAMLNFIKIPLVGSLFPSMMGPFTFNRLSTCLMSNFPGTPDFPSFQGVKVTDMMFGTGTGPGCNGIGFSVCSCNDHIRILSCVDPSILETDNLVAELNSKIVQEFRNLHALSKGTA